MEEITRGNIYYNKYVNNYLLVTGAIFIDEVKYVCMVFDGYESDHHYVCDRIVPASVFEEDRYVRVGGIY